MTTEDLEAERRKVYAEACREEELGHYAMAAKLYERADDLLLAACDLSDDAITARLEYLRGEIRAERISYGEIAEMQDLAQYIDPADTELLQWAGVPEFPEDETP